MKKRVMTSVQCYFQLVFLKKCIQSHMVTQNSLTTPANNHQTVEKASYQVATGTTALMRKVDLL